MANYYYPINVNISQSGATANQPNCGNPYLILVTTATTLGNAQTYLSGTSTSYGCFEITGTSGENRLVFLSTSSTVYVAVCAVRPGCTYYFESSYCGQVYTSGRTFSIKCTITENGNALYSRAASASTYWTSHGVVYNKRYVGFSRENKPYITRSTAPTQMSISTGFATNQYIPVKNVGHSGSACHAGSISARTISTYSIPVSLYVDSVNGSFGTIEIYVSDQPNNYGSAQDSMQIWHSYGTIINGDSDTLYCYTDSPVIYLGVHVDYSVYSYIRIFRDGTQISGGYFSGYQWEIELTAADIGYATGFTVHFSGS